MRAARHGAGPSCQGAVGPSGPRSLSGRARCLGSLRTLIISTSAQAPREPAAELTTNERSSCWVAPQQQAPVGAAPAGCSCSSRAAAPRSASSNAKSLSSAAGCTPSTAVSASVYMLILSGRSDRRGGRGEGPGSRHSSEISGRNGRILQKGVPGASRTTSNAHGCTVASENGAGLIRGALGSLRAGGALDKSSKGHRPPHTRSFARSYQNMSLAKRASAPGAPARARPAQSATRLPLQPRPAAPRRAGVACIDRPVPVHHQRLRRPRAPQVHMGGERGRGHPLRHARLAQRGDLVAAAPQQRGPARRRRGKACCYGCLTRP
jgi:hypothetical protein